MIITSWIQSPSWIIWTHYLTPSLWRNPPAPASLRRCCEIWIATKAHSAAPPSGVHEQNVALAHAGAWQMLPRYQREGLGWNKHWHCDFATHGMACVGTQVSTALRNYSQKNRERGQPRTLAGKGDTRGLIREREKQRNSTWQKRWVMDFFSFFSRNCRWAPVAYHSEE